MTDRIDLKAIEKRVPWITGGEPADIIRYLIARIRELEAEETEALAGANRLIASALEDARKAEERVRELEAAANCDQK